MKDEAFKCQSCPNSFSSYFELREHCNLHTGESPFMCIFCPRKFQTVRAYVCHAVEVHGVKCDSMYDSDADKPGEPVDGTAANAKAEVAIIPDSTFGKRRKIRKLGGNKQPDRKNRCNKCNITFDSVKRYRNHKRQIHTFICENCNIKFPSSEKLLRHVCFMLGDEEPFKCSCGTAFTDIDQFKLHIGTKPYTCCKCSMRFNRITNLVRHIRTHTKQKPYICKQCGRGFSQSTNLKNHMSIHLGIKAIQCDMCNFTCKTISGLLKHKKKHNEGYLKEANYIDRRKTSVGMISCPICKKEFAFKRNVGMHMKIHSKKESLCQECGKVFDTKSKLTIHYKACHGVPSICQVCGKTFASSVLLAAHEKTHVTGKTFSCGKCSKKFSIKNYLVRHMKTHIEGKNFSCSTCGKLFKVAVSLKYHSKICMTHHK